jgi:ABC-type uncharacterized transport system permease subunit
VNDSIVVVTLAAAIIAGTPLVFAGLGELLTQRSGVMNLGVEGMMLVGGMTGFWVHQWYASLYLGLIAGMLAGATMAAIFAVLAIGLRANQIVTGLALVIFGQGLTRYLGQSADPPLSSRIIESRYTAVVDSGPADWPVVGPLLLGHDPLIYASWLLALVIAVYFARTRAGLATIAVGEDPATADAAGISVTATRYVHTLIGGALAGLGGCYLTLASIGQWQDDITAGAGWIAFALVIVAQWRPWRLLFAAYVFGGLIRLGLTLRLLDVNIPGAFLNMVPYVVAVLALTLMVARQRSGLAAVPAALTKPFVRESR